MRHELCAVTIDSQDDVPWTKVTLSGFASWCYLQVTFIHTQSIRSQGGKEKKKICYKGYHTASEEREKVEEKKSIRSRVSPQRPNSANQLSSDWCNIALGQQARFTFFKRPQRQLEVRGQEQFAGSAMESLSLASQRHFFPFFSTWISPVLQNLSSPTLSRFRSAIAQSRSTLCRHLSPTGRQWGDEERGRAVELSHWTCLIFTNTLRYIW